MTTPKTTSKPETPSPAPIPGWVPDIAASEERLSAAIAAMHADLDKVHRAIYGVGLGEVQSLHDTKGK